jgi:hypothetical protein
MEEASSNDPVPGIARLHRHLDLGSAIEMEAMTQALIMKSHDHGEFYAAWREGREPAWAGR